MPTARYPMPRTMVPAARPDARLKSTQGRWAACHHHRRRRHTTTAVPGRPERGDSPARSDNQGGLERPEAMRKMTAAQR